MTPMLRSFVMLLVISFLPAGMLFGQTGGNGEPEPAEQVEQPRVDAERERRLDLRGERRTPEPPRANQNIIPVTYNRGVLPFLVFWQNHMHLPEDKVPWHIDVKAQLGIDESEFHRMGFARRDDIWIPIFFARRFMMMANAYNHVLVVMGQPERIPASKGITVEPYGTVIENDGFDLFMPLIASVSRAAKAQDELDSLELASMQLKQYGFQDIVWFRDRSRDPSGVAEGWTIY